MTLTRRTLLVNSGGAAVLALLPLAAWPAAPSLRAYRPQPCQINAAAAARFQAGQTLLVDSAAQSFTGDGLYLYPAWGSPRPYWVSAGGADCLQFRDPATGTLLWEQNAAADSHFAAAVVAELAAGASLPVAVPALQVPRLPV